MNYIWPYVSVSADFTPGIQPNLDQKYSKKKKIQKVPKKQNLNFPRAGNYLYSVYIVLGIVSNLEMI